jgi:hypothetical protein
MSKVVRSVFVRLCGALGVHGLRRRVRLPLSITLSETVWPGRVSVACAGHTRDISGTGLSFVLPTTRIGDRHIFNEGRAPLRIRLDLPGGAVDMCAAPVRYDLVGGRSKERGYLVGVQILDMRAEDRARYHEFLRTSARGPHAAQIKTSNSAQATPHAG